MAAKKKVKKSKKEVTHEIEENIEEEEEEDLGNDSPKSAKEHSQQLQRLQEKDPEFYQFLKEHDKDLLEFNDEEDEEDEEDEDIETDVDGEEMQEDEEQGTIATDKEVTTSRKVITSAMVDTWCTAIKENSSLGAVRSLMRAFRTACHYGDDGGDEDLSKLSVMPSNVFNKIMLFVLNEMDGVLRGLLMLPSSGGKKETVLDVVNTRPWKNHNHLVKSYLGNALHVLNQMTDTEMISFTLKRLRYSTIFLAPFPSLLRKYIKVGLHFWGTGGGALPVVSFLFLRDLCVRIGSDCVDDCFKGIYKAYVLNCQFVNAKKLQHIQFLGNCVIELLRVDLSAAYQHAFLFIRQLAMILKEALTMKTKESFRKVYEWKYMNCLELWTGAICAYSSEADLSPLAYPLTQIMEGFSFGFHCGGLLTQNATNHASSYELPDSHPILEGADRRDPDDLSSYLFVVWEKEGVLSSKHRSLVSPTAEDCRSPKSEVCREIVCCCSSFSNIEEHSLSTVYGTLMIPVRSTNRGTFPLNGTYFQVNEVYADDESTQTSIVVPRKWLLGLLKRYLYCGRSARSTFKVGAEDSEVLHHA